MYYLVVILINIETLKIDHLLKVVLMEPNNNKIEEKATITEVATVAGFQKAMSDKSTSLLEESNLRLFFAVMLGTLSDVKKAIKEGADVNALNLNQVCPLELARAYNRKNVAKVLEASGAHIHHPTDTKKTRPAKKH